MAKKERIKTEKTGRSNGRLTENRAESQKMEDKIPELRENKQNSQTKGGHYFLSIISRANVKVQA